MTSLHVIGVLDLTFMDIKEEADLVLAITERGQHILPNSPGKLTKLILDDFSNNGTKDDATKISLAENTVVINNGFDSPTKKNSREEVKAIRLTNNNISSLVLLVNPITNILDVSKVLWLDLSFNLVKKISDEFIQAFPNLTTLYLQANQISRLSELKKFSKFVELKSLSLYGNPIEDHKHYRNYTFYYCPNLTQFDMSPVTKVERKLMDVWYATFKRKLTELEEIDNRGY
jgi:Leucine-rich repeat (LRR) protein